LRLLFLKLAQMVQLEEGLHVMQLEEDVQSFAEWQVPQATKNH
jgi:hypothetical protein